MKEFEDKGYFKSRDDEYQEYKRKKELFAREKAEKEREDKEQQDTQPLNTSIDSRQPEGADYADFGGIEDFNYEDAIAAEEDDEKYFEMKELSKSNKSVKALLELREVLGEDYEDTKELREYIDEIGIYKVAPDVITLQEAVNHSRRRVNQIDEKVLKHYEDIEERVKAFLSSTYNMSEIGIIFHQLHYPQDYQWVNHDEDIICNNYEDCYTIDVGAHEYDHREIDLQDYETWPLYDVNNVDIDVECEVNFQQLLRELGEKIGKGKISKDYIDMGLRIPYSQLSKASSYEIRLIDFLRQLNYTPRVSVCIFKNDNPLIDRATFSLTYIPIHKYSE